MMRIIIITIAIFFSIKSFGQCKTYRLSGQGDTLNCIDMKDKKQGKWVIHLDNVHGEPGFEEEGEFKDDKREGMWRKYNLMGDFIAIENYRYGYKDGLSQYYDMFGLEHEEFWHSINPIYPFDTVYVPNVNDPDKYEMKIVKVEASTVKHGNWRYYDSQTGNLLKTESYLFDKLQELKVEQESGKGSGDESQLLNGKPKEVLEFERKIANKRRIRIRDGDVK